MLNDSVRSNFRQSIAANRCCETVEFWVNRGTHYVFVVYLRGVDPQFREWRDVLTARLQPPSGLDVERPK